LAYRIDFTERRYRLKRTVVWVIAISLMALCVMLAVLGMRVYRQWEKPTLAEKLAAMHGYAEGMEPVYRDWMACVNAFNSVAPFYHLFWSTNAVETLATMLSREELLPRSLQSLSWSLKTGGDCELQFALKLEPQERRHQLTETVEAIRSLVAPLEAKVSWAEHDLAAISELDITLAFTLPGPAYESVPSPPAVLQRTVDHIDATRKAVQAYQWTGQSKRDPLAVINKLETIYKRAIDDDSHTSLYWRKQLKSAVDPYSFLRELERDLEKHNRPVPPELVAFRDEWQQLASRRLPWRRLKILDTPQLESDVEILKALTTGVPAPLFFESIMKRIAILKATLRGGYERESVFDETILRSRVKQACNDLPLESDAFDVQESASHDGFILATWSLRMTHSDAVNGVEHVVELHDFLSALERILALKVGFVVDQVAITFDDARPMGLTVIDARATGLLAVCDEQAVVEDSDQGNVYER
jgi:hypothetical protein